MNAKYQFLLGGLIITLSFCLGHYVYFCLLPLPGFYNDFISYLEVAEKMKQTVLPVSDWIPVGYPVFIRLSSLLNNSIHFLILSQCILFLASLIFLLAAIHRTYPQITLLCSIALSIFTLNTWVVDYNTGLMSESIYLSFLLITTGIGLISLKRSCKKYMWIVLPVFFVLLMLIRPTGLVYFGFVLWFLLFFLITKAKKSVYLTFLGTWLAACLLWMSYNYYTLGEFNIGYPARFRPFSEDKVPKYQRDYQARGEEYANKLTHKASENRLSNFWQYFNNLNSSRTFYSVLSDRHHRLYDQSDTFQFLGFHDKYRENCFLFMPRANLDSLVFREYYPKPKSLDMAFSHLNDSRIFKAQDLLYIKVYAPLFRNIIWAVLFFAAGAFAFASFLFDPAKRDLSGSILFIFTLNFAAGLLFLRSVNFYPMNRYSYPAEFSYYLILPFIFLLLKKYFDNNVHR